MCAALCGCMVGPDFEKPKADKLLGESYSKKADNKADNQTLAAWWKTFGDDELNSLIERALSQNLDLEIAKYRVLQARANLGITQSSLLPVVDLNAAMAEKTKNTMINKASPTYSAGLTSSWEIDVFGATRREIESKIALYEAAFASQAASRISIAAEVADCYFKYRATQICLIITKKNLQTQKNTCQITQQRRNNGFVSELDVVRAQAQVESTMSEIPTLESTLKTAQNALELLLAVKSGSLKDELEGTPAKLPDLENYIPYGVPAELLERRPDIIAAEYDFRQAMAQIGVAQADLLPKFSITGSISYQAPDIGNMFQNQYGTWSVGPNISWNIFNAGKTLFNIERQKTAAKEYEAKWKQTVLTAAKEVEDGIVSSQKSRQKIDILIELVRKNQKAFDISKKLYSEGELEFLDLLETQRSLLTSEQNLVNNRKNLISDFISLYKALGGGWSIDDINRQKEDLQKYIIFTDGNSLSLF